MFIDQIRIHARAGRGGDGSVHFRRVAKNPKGGPDGGDGGRGGSVVLEVSPHVDNLRKFFYDPRLFAEDGKPGGAQRRSGRAGRDKVVPVPPGTLVWKMNVDTLADAVTAEREEADWLEYEPVADLTKTGEKFVLAKGGRGGRGNDHFKSSVNRAPTDAEEGGPGEEGIFKFEMRMIADVGLVGFPNAGKSTLLSVLSAAKPKIAAYPFTTLQPMVGVMDFPGFRRGTVADIPGLIEGAHENVGLGHEFLRHILRCRVLLFVLDAAGSEGRDPVEDLRLLRREVGLYDEELARRPWMIAANKADLEGAADGFERIRSAFPKQQALLLSASSGDGVDALRSVLDTLIAHEPV